MGGRCTCVVVLTVAAGCSRPPAPVDKAREYVAGWADMGARLPSDQVTFFRTHLAEVKGVLSEALSHINPDVRQRAAYVIEELGPSAMTLGPDVERALRVESERLVRLYLYDALRSIGTARTETVSYLTNRFESLAAERDVSTGGALYTPIDERIYLAADLYVLDSSGEKKSEHLGFVLQWLHPPKAGLSTQKRETYWEHRWCAVNAIEHMAGAEEAIPLLEAMLTEQDAKPWVGTHVPRALRALRPSASP